MSQKLNIKQNIWFCSSIDSEPQQGEITIPLRDQSMEIRMPNGRRRLLDASQIYLTREDAEQAALLGRPEMVAAKISSLPKLLAYLYSDEWKENRNTDISETVRKRIKELTDVEIEESRTKNYAEKPLEYIIDGEHCSFSTWRGSLIRHCEEIIRRYGLYVFTEKSLSITPSGKAGTKKVFARTAEEFGNTSAYRLGDGIYLGANYSAEYVKMINQRLNEVFPAVSLEYVFAEEEENASDTPQRKPEQGRFEL